MLLPNEVAFHDQQFESLNFQRKFFQKSQSLNFILHKFDFEVLTSLNTSLFNLLQLKALIFLTFVKLLTITQSLPMKINTGYYGIPKQLYHTTYSPLETSRASSLQTNPSFTHSHHPQNMISRPENVSPVLIMRDLPRNNLSNSQASQQDLKSKLIPHDYYSKNTTNEDLLMQIQVRMEEINKKVNKNTDDIKQLKQKEKNTNSYTEIENKFGEQIQKIQQKQALMNEECLLKIVKVKEELFEMSTKAVQHQNECSQKLGLKVDEKMLIKVRNLIEERVKQETAKIRLIIQNETNKLVHELRWELKNDTSSSSPIKSKLKYPFKPIKLNYNEFMQVALTTSAHSKGRMSTRQSSESPRSGRYILSNQKIYFIDKDGYLLDEDSYYLLDQNENMIRLNHSMLVQLRKEGILKQ